MWKIGQKLVCVDNSRMFNCMGIPLQGEVYTFDGVDPALQTHIYLKELNVPCEPGSGYDGERDSYRATCFRPVDETFGESVAEKLEKEFISQPEPALV